MTGLGPSRSRPKANPTDPTLREVTNSDGLLMWLLCSEAGLMKH